MDPAREEKRCNDDVFSYGELPAFNPGLPQCGGSLVGGVSRTTPGPFRGERGDPAGDFLGPNSEKLSMVSPELSVDRSTYQNNYECPLLLHPSLDRSYPVSTVLRASPPPRGEPRVRGRARPVPRGRPVEGPRALTAWGFPCCVGSPCTDMPSSLPRWPAGF